MKVSERFTKTFTNLCSSLGKNNKSLYSALTIAISKGTLRPTFTMMDKKQDKPSRKYAAFREGLTGAVAIVSYLVTDNIVEKMAVPFCKKANMLDRLPEVKPVLSLFSVSLSALFIIPMICNFATKPLLDKFSKKQSNPLKPQITPTSNNVKFTSLPPVYRNFSYNGNLRIGG